MAKRFIIYGLLGWCLEVFWTGLGSLLHGDLTLSAQTYIWMFPIYGLAVLLEFVHNRIRHLPVTLRGGVYTVLIYAIEYVTGIILKTFIGRCPWNYGTDIFSINGIITLRFIPVWFIAGLLFELIHDTLLRIEFIRE